MSLLFNICLGWLVKAFLPRSKHLLISWLQSPSAVILEPKKIKFYTVFIVSPSICHEVVGLDGMILVIWMLIFKPAFLFSSFACIKRLFSSSSISAIPVVHLYIWDYWYFFWQSWFQLMLHPAWHFALCTLQNLRCQDIYIMKITSFIIFYHLSFSKKLLIHLKERLYYTLVLGSQCFLLLFSIINEIHSLYERAISCFYLTFHIAFFIWLWRQ